MLKKILLGLMAIILIAQFIQPSKNKGNRNGTNDIRQAVTVPDSIMALLSTACYDCHSNKTNYPWYSHITPVNWWLKDHVDEGKKHLNFTEFKTYSLKKQDHKLEEIVETVENHSMPLDSYLWIHDEAALSEQQRKMLVDWANASRQTIQKNGPF